MLAQKLLMIGSAPKLVNLTHSQVINSVGSTFTFTSAPIGAAGTNRHIVVAVMGQTNGSDAVISGVTIGGAAMTSATKTGLAREFTGIFYLNVTTGTTATIVVSTTGPGSGEDVGIAVYSLENWATLTLVDSGSNSSNSSDFLSISSQDATLGGFEVQCISVNTSGGNGGGTLITAGSTNVTGTGFSGKSDKVWPTSSQTGQSIVVTNTSASGVAGSVASFS